MKKIIFLFVCILAFCSFAGQKTAAELREEVRQLQGGTNEYNEWWNARTVEDLRVLADYVLLVASTNMAAAYGIGGKVMQCIFCHWNSYPMPGNALAAEYDEKFKNGPYCGGTRYWKLAPKATIAYLESKKGKEYEAKHPAWCNRVRRACRDKKMDMSFPCYANIMAECGSVFNLENSYSFTLDSWKNKILGKAASVIRHRLRDLGKPITTKDGVNPIQDALDRLTETLNAPKMSGLKEWCAEWCPDYRWIDIKWMSDEELKAYKDDIYYGDRKFGNAEKFILCAYLGVDEYNKFVKAFNCEKE